jgi:hypothetical protein
MKILSLILLLATSANAGVIGIAGPFKGLNNTDPAITIVDGEAQDALNVEVSDDLLSINKLCMGIFYTILTMEDMMNYYQLKLAHN